MWKLIVIAFAAAFELAVAGASRVYNESGCEDILDTSVVSQCKKTIKLIGHFDTFSPFKNATGGIFIENTNQGLGKSETATGTRLESKIETESGAVKIIQVPVIIKENNEDIRRIAAATETLATVSILSLVAFIAITIISVIIVSK